MKKNKVILLIGLIALIIFIAVYLKIKNSSVKVDPLVVRRGDMIEATYAVGTLKSEKVYNLKTGVNAKLVERYVRLGEKIKKGSPLLKLDSYPVFVAPFDGTITLLNYEVGELVFSNSTVLTLVSDSQLYLELSLDERSIYKIKLGDEAIISFANQKKKTNGKVKYVFSNADQFYVHVFFDKKDLSLLPGMTCDVSIITRKFENKLLVPVKAISNNSVTLKNGNKVNLNILYRNDSEAAVDNNDLKENDELVFSQDVHQRSRQSKNQSMGH